MNLRFVASCGLVCAALVFTGCSDTGRKAPGKTTVQVANAAPGFPSLQFRREQDQNGAVEMPFKDGRTFIYDADTYDFFVSEPTFSAADPGRVWTFAPKLDANTIYQFILTEVAGEVVPVVITVPPLPTGDAAQIFGLHAAASLPAMDLYLERPGVGIAGATPRATVNPTEQFSPRTLPSGDYELFVTAAGNPADIWLTSAPINLPAGTNASFVIVDQRGTGTERINVMLIQGASTILFDRNAPSELRTLNGAPDQMPRDVAINSVFSPPLFSATPFAAPTPYKPVPLGAYTVNVTPVGNPGVLEIDTQTVGVIGERVTMLFGGQPGTLLPVFAVDDTRRLNREAKLRFMNAASQFTAIDFTVVLPDGDPNVAFPQATLFPPGAAPYVTLHAGDYDLYMHQAGTTTILLGPTRITVAAGGVYGILAVDGPDTATANAVYFDDFVP
jgi:hypothetical protein